MIYTFLPCPGNAREKSLLHRQPPQVPLKNDSRETTTSVLGKRPPIIAHHFTSTAQLRDLTLLFQRQTPPLDALAMNRPRTAHAQDPIIADERFSWNGEVERRSVCKT